MHKSRGQSRRHGRRSHRHNPWFRQHGSNERNNTGAQQSPQGSSHSDDEAPSTSSSTAGSSSVPDLPGYYFDPEKKRYFRLLPGHNNCNPLTKESIRQKEMESKRLQLLEEEDKQGKKIARLGFNASSLLQKSKLGFLNVTSYCRLAHELRVSCMQRKKVQIQSSDPSALASDRFNLILADTNSDRLFTVNDVKVGGSKYGIINLHGLKTPTLRVHMHENLYFTNRKVNAVSWASLNHLDSHILYLLAGDLYLAVLNGFSRLCLMGIAETPGCATLLPASLFVSSHPAGDRPGMLCSFRIPGAWSCAWSLNIQANNCFSTGLSRRVLVTSVVTGHRQSFGTSSDVLAQQFAITAPLLFNGCRSGEIFAIDLRCRNQGKGWKATCLFHDSAVTSVQILQGEQCLMASDMAGTIKLWDLRTTKCVRQYEGHVNEYAHLPLHVHEEEGIVVAVGQDCYTRIWSLHDAQLLRTIPSPHPTSKADIPSVAFSSRLGGFRGAPGLLMAIRQDLYCFSYS
ncbi:DDB1- and CUL4-associated factor 4 isoform X1 [Balaenoptera ricei]|uniref:DDB1- and CUL4-associated factor 4 isoform X1 n=2 Tax=Balaenoptera ricei TaxID=2746895 RepID=UPI0028BF10A0|nr:DDB1- and CUL4-associated factor 4 isoform X1 [Balaenoptera ricei]XP_059770550.1 DDB1- and CUL4-associated factor 4 isoform X1 [Balaenoptera ricei]